MRFIQKSLSTVLMMVLSIGIYLARANSDSQAVQLPEFDTDKIMITVEDKFYVAKLLLDDISSQILQLPGELRLSTYIDISKKLPSGFYLFVTDIGGSTLIFDSEYPTMMGSKLNAVKTIRDIPIKTIINRAIASNGDVISYLWPNKKSGNVVDRYLVLKPLVPKKIMIGIAFYR